MKPKPFALSLLSTALVGTAMVAGAQSDRTVPLRPTQPPMIRCADGTCKVRMMTALNFGNGVFATAISAEPNPTYLSYATSLFNPKEYSINRVDSIVWPSADGKGDTSFPLTDLFPMPLAFAAAQTDRANKSVQWEPHRAFLESSSSAMVVLPPAVSAGPVDPIGHIWCVVKTKTKSNQSNDRPANSTASLDDPTFVGQISATGIQISVDNGDGQGPFVFAPTALSQLKLTKGLSVGRVASVDSFTWVRILSNGGVENVPVEYNMLALDAASKDAAKMTIRFKPEQSLRVTVHYPNLCDVTGVCKFSVTYKGPIPTSPLMFKIDNQTEACRLLPTVNK